MKTNRKIYGLLFWAIISSALLLISACSSTSGPEFTLPVSINAKIAASSQSKVDYVTLTVTLEDNILYEDTVELLLGQVESVIEIPPGRNIEFVLNAYSAEDVLIYSGSDVSDVGLGEDIVVTIEMVPQVLMLKVDPLYLEFHTLSTGEQYFDIYVYNAIDLFGASFRINYLSNIIAPTRVEFNSNDVTNFLGTEVLAFSKLETGYIAMSVVKLRGQNPVSGNGILARVYFNLLSQGDTGLQFDTETVSLVDENENPIANTSSLILEDGYLAVTLPIP